jgi:hypothetical protein
MNVQRQVAGLFIAEERGAHQLKGVSEPIQLFRIVRASGSWRRGGARSLTPFRRRGGGIEPTRTPLGARAGRRWPILLIVGEPGLGKSRLVEEFRALLAESPHASNGALRSSCRTRRRIRSPNGAGNALVARIYRPRSALPTWNAPCGRWTSTPMRACRCPGRAQWNPTGSPGCRASAITRVDARSAASPLPPSGRAAAPHNCWRYRLL